MQPILISKVKNRVSIYRCIEGRGETTYHVTPDGIPSLMNFTHTAIGSVELCFKHIDCCITIPMVHRKTNVD